MRFIMKKHIKHLLLLLFFVRCSYLFTAVLPPSVFLEKAKLPAGGVQADVASPLAAPVAAPEIIDWRPLPLLSDVLLLQYYENAIDAIISELNEIKPVEPSDQRQPPDQRQRLLESRKYALTLEYDTLRDNFFKKIISNYKQKHSYVSCSDLSGDLNSISWERTKALMMHPKAMETSVFPYIKKSLKKIFEEKKALGFVLFFVTDDLACGAQLEYEHVVLLHLCYPNYKELTNDIVKKLNMAAENTTAFNANKFFIYMKRFYDKYVELAAKNRVVICEFDGKGEMPSMPGLFSQLSLAGFSHIQLSTFKNILDLIVRINLAKIFGMGIIVKMPNPSDMYSRQCFFNDVRRLMACGVQGFDVGVVGTELSSNVLQDNKLIIYSTCGVPDNISLYNGSSSIFSLIRRIPFLMKIKDFENCKVCVIKTINFIETITSNFSSSYTYDFYIGGLVNDLGLGQVLKFAGLGDDRSFKVLRIKNNDGNILGFALANDSTNQSCQFYLNFGIGKSFSCEDLSTFKMGDLINVKPGEIRYFTADSQMLPLQENNFLPINGVRTFIPSVDAVAQVEYFDKALASRLFTNAIDNLFCRDLYKFKEQEHKILPLWNDFINFAQESAVCFKGDDVPGQIVYRFTFYGNNKKRNFHVDLRHNQTAYVFFVKSDFRAWVIIFDVNGYVFHGACHSPGGFKGQAQYDGVTYREKQISVAMDGSDCLYLDLK